MTSEEGTEVGDTKITVAEEPAEGNVYAYKVLVNPAAVEYDDDVSGTSWHAWDGEEEITAEPGKVITVVEATSEYKARKAGHTTVTAKEETVEPGE